MAAARRAAVKIAFLGGAGGFFAARSARDVAAAGGERLENWIEVLDDFFFAANHLAVAAIKAPDAATGANVAIVNTFRAEFFGTANIVKVIRRGGVILGFFDYLRHDSKNQDPPLLHQETACRTALERALRPDFKFLPRWTRSTRRPRSARTLKSPRACAAFTMPNVYLWP